jgi:hypothetical protein
MYGMMYGVKRTTVYLPDDLKHRLERRAARLGVTEAEIIRRALTEALDHQKPAPTLPLFPDGWGDPTLAESVDDALAGFGDR